MDNEFVASIVEVEKSDACDLAFKFNERVKEFNKKGFKVYSVNYYERERWSYPKYVFMAGYQILFCKETSQLVPSDK